MNKPVPNRRSRADRPSPPFNARPVPGGGPRLVQRAPARIARSLYQHRMLLIGLFCLRASRPPGDEPRGRDEKGDNADKADQSQRKQAASRRRETDREAFLRWVGEQMLAGAREQMTREEGSDQV